MIKAVLLTLTSVFSTLNDQIISGFKVFCSNRIFIPFVLLLIMISGFLVRYDDLKSWEANPGQAFFQDKPLLTTFDGYFYLNLSRDLLRGEYDAVDEKQVVPAGRPRPYPPPLLAVLGAFVTRITGASLDMVGTVLPAVLGVLLALPLYLLGSFYGGKAMGITAALSSLFFPYYVYRSNVGWFDTDCLNVTFATFIVYCILQFAMRSGRTRYYWGLAALCSYGLFLWWWDQAHTVVSVIFLATSLIALVVFYRPEKREGYIFIGILAGLVLLLLFWQGFELPQKIYDTIANDILLYSHFQNQCRYFSKPGDYGIGASTARV